MSEDENRPPAESETRFTPERREVKVEAKELDPDAKIRRAFVVEAKNRAEEKEGERINLRVKDIDSIVSALRREEGEELTEKQLEALGEARENFSGEIIQASLIELLGDKDGLEKIKASGLVEGAEKSGVDVSSSEEVLKWMFDEPLDNVIKSETEISQSKEVEPVDRSKIFQEALEEIGVDDEDRKRFVAVVLVKAMELSELDEELNKNAMDIFGELQALLKKKREGTEEDDEEVSILELLMLMLRLLWNEVKKALEEEIFPDIVENGETKKVEDKDFPHDLRFGAYSDKTDEERFGGVFYEFLGRRIEGAASTFKESFINKAQRLGIEGVERLPELSEGESAETVEPEQRPAGAEGGRREPPREPPGSTEPPPTGEGDEHEDGGGEDGGGGAARRDDVDRMNLGGIQGEARGWEAWVNEFSDKIIADYEKSGDPTLRALGVRLRKHFDDPDRRQNIEEIIGRINQGDEDDLESLRRDLENLREYVSPIHEIIGSPEARRRYLQIYGPKAEALLEKVDNYESLGIFRLLTVDFDSSEFSEERYQTFSSEVDKLRKWLDRQVEMTGLQADLFKEKGGLVEARKKNVERRKFEAQLQELNDWAEQQEEGFQITDMRREVSELQKVLRVRFVTPLFDEIVGEAESDTRQPFRMESWSHILINEFTDRLKEAGPLGANEARRYDQFLFTRWGIHNVNTVYVIGGGYEDLVKASSRVMAEDFDTLMEMVPGLGSSFRKAAAILKRVRNDPKNNGRFPPESVIVHPKGKYAPSEIEREVAESLKLESESGVLTDFEGRPVSFHEKVQTEDGEVIKLTQEGKEEANRLAAMGVKLANLMRVTTDEISQTPYRTGDEEMVSTPHDRLRVDYLREDKRFSSHLRAREVNYPFMRRLEQFIQPGVREKIPGEKIDEWNVNPENPLHGGGEWSGTSWRAKIITAAQRDKGLAKSVEIKYIKNKSGKVKKEHIEAGEAKMKDLGKTWKELRMIDWKAIAERNPTAIADFWATVVLKSVEKKKDFFDFDKRLRKDVLGDWNLGNFETFAQGAADRWFEKENIGTDVWNTVKADKKAGQLRWYQSEKSELKKRTWERRREVQTQVGAKMSFFWMVGEVYGINDRREGENEVYGILKDERNSRNKNDWDTAAEKWEKEVGEAWKKLARRVDVLEEHGMQEYLRDGYEDEKVDETKYKTVAQLIEGRARNMNDKDRDLVKALFPEESEFSEKEKKLVLQLAYLGSSERQAETGAERLASVEFSYFPFHKDIAQEKLIHSDLGPREYMRRDNDMALYWEKAKNIETNLLRGLAGKEDQVAQHPQEIIKGLAEYHNVLSHMGEIDQFENTAFLAQRIVNNLYKADRWTKIPLLGPLLDWGGPVGLWRPLFRSSAAQRKFGTDALSMTALERWQFVNKLEPYIGRGHAKKLKKDLGATMFKHVIPELGLQYGPGVPLYLLGSWFKEFIQRAYQGLKGEAQSALQGQ